MPPRSRRKTARTQRTPAEDDSDDPLALSPLDRPRSVKTHVRPQRSTDRVVGGVELAEGDLVPPSDEDEFDAWARDSTVARARAAAEETVSSPSLWLTLATCACKVQPLL
jgi:hypothetical protein